jgi:hypothetical protein
VVAQPVSWLETGFERDVNRYRWTAQVGLSEPVGAWHLALDNRFASEAFILFEDQLSFREENLLAVQALRPFSPRLQARMEGRAAWYSLSRVYTQDVYGSLRLQARRGWVEPLLGLAWDRRPGAAAASSPAPLRLDFGPAYGLRLELPPATAGGYTLGLVGDGRWQVLTPRHGRAARLEGQAERLFENDTRLHATLRLASVRRDVYEAASFLNRDAPAERASEAIEATTSDTLLASVELEAPFYRQLRIGTRLDVGLNDRRVRTRAAPAEAVFFDSDFNRQTFDLEAGLRYEDPDAMLYLATRAGAEVERRILTNADDLPPAQAAQTTSLLQQADYDRGAFLLLARTRANLSRRTSASFDGTASILRHDTPALNPDDRDELYYNGTLGLTQHLRPTLALDLQLFGTWYHTVYLRATRSAENNIQRSLRLRPSVQYTPSRRTKLRLGSEVRATYTVADFVLPGRRPNDQAARELRFDAALEQAFGPGHLLRADGSLSDLRLGRFFDSTFSEIPFDTLRTYNGWIRLQTGQRLLAEIGVRIFLRTDFERATTVRYVRLDAEGNLLRDENGAFQFTTITRPGRERIAQVGPTCALTWPMRDGAALRITGWLVVQRIRHRLYGDLPEGLADHIRQTARTGTRTFIPNLAITTRWNF